jgi:serine/threonine-protein kinase
MPVNDDLIGVTVGHCVIEELLGQGGMARVYRGRQENLDRHVAIKILPPYYAADPSFVERFKLEARAMAKLTHPNIVTVHDAGEDAGHLYIIMEYVSGGTLKQRMAGGLHMPEIQRVIREVASALTYAHGQGIVHRDVKPVNVLMDMNGRSVLSDFGIAKVLQTSAALTHAGAGVGTPEYMSPEQCRGNATVDARADIYALGIMLYEMLAGRTPFVADNYTALAHSHIYEPVPPPSRINPRISPAVQSVVMKALEKNPADRFQKATEMAVALDQAVAAQTPVAAMTGRAAAQPAPAPPRPMPAYSTIVCPRCQQPNAAQQRFCSFCGQPLVPGQSPPPGSYQQYPQATGSWTSCPYCLAMNKPVNRFCTQCGKSLLVGVAPLLCRTCGARNTPGQRFCTTCGAPLH